MYISPRNPNYIPPRSKYICSICNESIHNGEEYIENWNGDIVHWDCIYGIHDLLEWFGGKIKIMEDAYD